MRLLDKLDRRFGRLAMPHLTLVLVAGQVLFFLLRSSMPETLDLMVLDFNRAVYQGEVWRLASFLFIPPDSHPVFLLFAWYLFYLMGTALENHWGTFRFNLFIGLGWLGTVGAAALSTLLPDPAPLTNTYLAGSVFLAFAFLYPDFRILVMFILPVKVRWLAWITWISYGLSFASSDSWAERLSIAVAVSNFFFFFGRDILGNLRAANRNMRFRTAALRDETRPRHVCRVCEADNVTTPELDFRYCTDCKPAQCYCPKHLDHHAHVKEEPT